MERTEEAYTAETTEMLMSPRCLNCVERVNLPLWLPREVRDYLNLLTGDTEENRARARSGVKARMEEMTGASQMASRLTREIDRIVEDLTSR
jgi:hypothetical protein